ncbi:scm-like with four MBT domains protein 1 [Ranitomeya imitator]|uniref:scm-like with four MBT domains protein 1 n=1 Tax=Ranitomeya imitator TaxID=111125 RepID=UPI0037E75087
MGTLSAGPMSQSRQPNPAITTASPPGDMSAQEQNHEGTNADFSLEEAEFNWEEYLEETESVSAPHSFFKHVDTSMQTGLSPGMKLEVPLGTEPKSYWIASIITTCGKLLLLRYDGCGEDRSADFWCDIVTSDLHSIGWAQQNKKALRPPDILKEKLQNWEELLAETLKGTCSAPSHLLEGPQRGKDPLDLFGPGCRLELQHSQDSLAAWPVYVVDNIGGRLQLRYEGAPEWPSLHCFYLNPSLHELGWASKNGFEIKPPQEIVHLNTEEKWKEILAKCLEDPENVLPGDFFQEQAQIPNHTFTTGMKLEAINHKDPSCIVPATVNKVFNNQYFLVELDDLRPETSRSPQSMVCHRNSPQILPTRWSVKMGLTVRTPPGYTEEAFDWDKYLTHCNAHAAPDSCFPEAKNEHVLLERMKLEAVNPFQPQNICVATVTRVTGLYIWLQLEGGTAPVPECVVHLESTDIFPMGWCETNGHPLCTPPPTNAKPRKKTASNSQKLGLPAKNGHGVNGSDAATGNTTSNGKYLCPKIYFNHRCFSGPYLNKGRIAELPKSVGPGNCVLVLKEVLSLVINAAYKPSRVLRELELQDEPLWPQRAEILKAKYKGKTYRATVELVRTSDQVSEFCRKTCIKLECCPNLFGPLMVHDQCSENCSVLTKTKYTHYYGKRRGKNLSNPTGILRSIEAALKKPTKRRKRRKQFFVHKKKRTSNSIENTPVGSPQGSGEEEEEEDDEDYSPSEESAQEPHEGSEISGKGSSSSASPTRSEQSLKCEKKRKPWMLESDNLSAKGIRIELKEPLALKEIPIDWTVNDVVEYIKSTDCAHLAQLFQEQEIDGKALLLLNLPAVQDCMDLKPATAIRLCYHIERVKLAFYQSLPR